jgi:hypothetical protein
MLRWAAELPIPLLKEGIYEKENKIKYGVEAVLRAKSAK